MDTVTIIRRLWHFRLVVVATAIVSIVAGMFVSYDLPSMKSRKYTVGVGSARILVDTPASQVVDLSPEGSDTVSARAALLSSLMVDGEIKDAIAREAGLKPDELIGVNQEQGSPAEPKTGPPSRDDYVLSPEVTMISSNTWLPIIQVNTQAPDAASAEKLANATVSGLTKYLDSKAAQEAIPGAKRLRVTGLGAATASDETRGPSLTMSVATTLILFILGCAILLGVSGLAGALRNTPAPEQEPELEAEDEEGQRLATAPAPAAPPAQLYKLDRRREAVRAEKKSAAKDVAVKQQAAAASGRKNAPSDGSEWWGGGPNA